MIPIAASWASHEKHFEPREGSKGTLVATPSKARPRESNLSAVTGRSLCGQGGEALVKDFCVVFLMKMVFPFSGRINVNNNVKKRIKTMVKGIAIITILQKK